MTICERWLLLLSWVGREVSRRGHGIKGVGGIDTRQLTPPSWSLIIDFPICNIALLKGPCTVRSQGGSGGGEYGLYWPQDGNGG